MMTGRHSMSSKPIRKHYLLTLFLVLLNLSPFWGDGGNRHKVCIVTFITSSRLGRSSKTDIRNL